VAAAGARMMAGQRTIQLHKRLKQPPPVRDGNTNAGIPHCEGHQLAIRMAHDLQAYAPVVGGKFDGVMQQIDEHLLEASLFG
jgi:hypothetical protein